MSQERDPDKELRKRAAVLSHGLQEKIVNSLQKIGPASAAEVASHLRVSPDQVRYQLRQLAESGIVEVVDQKARRGVAERYYLAEGPETWLEDEELAELPPAERDRFLARILKFTLDSALSSLKAGLLTRRKGSVVVRIPLRIDAQAWSELAEIQREAIEQTLRVRAESRLRLREGEVEPILATAALFLFEGPPDS
jgi:DNA-binding Lrp family transcriptional regulator